MEESTGDRLLEGRYRLEGMLASVGMAEVYRAVDVRLGRLVAIKLPHPQFGAGTPLEERLIQETRLTSALDHPNIVRVYDCGTWEGRSFLVMELMEGRSLAALLEDSGTLPTKDALQVGREVLGALDHAHQRGVVHGDVKPHNVILAADRRAKLADFGIAETLSTVAPAKRATVLGTARYLAPERLEGEPPSVASDLYSAGVLLYQLLTGRLPAGGDSTAPAPSRTPPGTPLPPSAVRPSLPHWLDDVVLRAMAEDPRGRYPSAGAMLAALESGVSMHAAETRQIPLGGVASTRAGAKGRAEALPGSRSRRPRKDRQVVPATAGRRRPASCSPPSTAGLPRGSILRTFRTPAVAGRTVSPPPRRSLRKPPRLECVIDPSSHGFAAHSHLSGDLP